MAKIATLEEIEQHWSLADVLIANRLLDYQEYVERKAINEQRLKVK